jgi:hypothetical protein
VAAVLSLPRGDIKLSGFVFVKGEAVVEEIVGVVAQLVVARNFHDIFAAAGTGEVEVENIADLGRWTVGHHYQPIGEEQGLVDVLSDHQHGAFVRVPGLEKFLPQLLLGDGIKGAEGLIKDPYFRPNRKDEDNKWVRERNLSQIYRVKMKTAAESIMWWRKLAGKLL